MCGIAGIVHGESNELQRMVASLKHRGPDECNIYQDQHVLLGHTRLAIQDLVNGGQPFQINQYTIVFNGEIYNHLALRKLVPDFFFKTQSDTETLLCLFIKYQMKLFDFIDGMFAFVIYDRVNQSIWLARDRAGKKPLYYCQDQNRFIFASEINAIKQIKKFSISSDAVDCYLRTGFVWRPFTVFNDILELEPATYLHYDIQNANLKKEVYFNFSNYYEATTSDTFNESMDQLEVHLKQSIHDRIIASDVPVGVFLSGGIDSNLIAALASQIKPGIKTFTVQFDGAYDESHLAALTAARYQTEHVVLPISQHLQNDIEKILLGYGEPFMDSSAIPSYYVAQAASQHVKVVLSGDGADELFAGYRRYVPIIYRLPNHMKWLQPLLRFLPTPDHKQSYYHYFYRLLSSMNKTGLDFYLSTTTDIFEDILTIKNNMILNRLANFIHDIMAKAALSPLKKMLYLDFNIILFCDLLVKMDIASMANALEVRSPFLSKYLLEYSPSLPDSYKIKRFQTKYILRQLAKKYLPEALIHQPKRGFEVPLKRWVEYDLRETIHDYLQPGCYAENYLERRFINDLLHHRIAISAEKRAKILWSLYCLEVWYRHETKNFIHC